MAEEKKQSFIKGAAILTVSVALIKIMGAMYKIPLGNILGDRGMANFGVAYNIYSLLLTLSTAGLPVALSRMVSEAYTLKKYAQVRRTFHVARTAFFVLGFVSTMIMLLLPRQLAVFMGDQRAESALSIAVLAPAVVCVCLMSAYRGYTQGMSNMVPTSVSQIIETACKLLFGLTAAWWLMRSGRETAVGSAGGIFGVTAGTVLALAYIVLYKLRLDRRSDISGPADDEPESPGRTLKKLIAIGVPITIGACVLNIVAIIDTRMILTRLQNAAGFGYDEAKTLYGVYFNTQTLYNLPSAFMIPLTTSAIPAITSYAVSRRYRDASDIAGASIKLTCLIAMPAAVGMGVLAFPVMNVIYPNSHAEGSALLSILSIAAFFVCLTMTTNAVLQAYGHQNLPLLSIIAGGVGKVAVNYVLLGDPNFGIRGAAYGCIACYGLISVLNLVFIRKKAPQAPSLPRLFAKPLAASAVMGAGAWGAYRLAGALLIRAGVYVGGGVGMKLALAAAVAAGVIVYLLAVIFFGAISREELELVPKGEKIAKILRIK
ncbi:MAG: polysaccharide biosynthesis protein [Oscillospiraceae bacterium]|nr:polysaccharide biosynthesis protein [Oscillospiraceae bacterium]